MAPKIESVYHLPPKQIEYPNARGLFVCDCGGSGFRVGIAFDQLGNNYINVLECIVPQCGNQYPVPDHSNLPGFIARRYV